MVHFARRDSGGDIEIAVSEKDGVRSLHLGGNMIQSAMKIAAPYDLELFYTQCMMAFMLFNPEPKNILNIGLGGGSLAKFIYQHLPHATLTTVEINQQIIVTAQNFFELPEENERFKIIQADAATYITEYPDQADIIILDGFDDDNQVPTLCSQAFYNQLHQKLTKTGILVINLLSRDKQVNDYLRRIETSFDGHVTTLLSEARGNLIVFAFKRNPGKISWKTLRNHAKRLEKNISLPFTNLVSKLRKSQTGHGDFFNI